MVKKKSKKKFNLKKEYKDSWNYIKESKKFIYFIIALFFVFTMAGFFISLPQSIIEQILNFIKELLEKTKGMNQIQLIKFIFFNNLQSSFFGMIFGALFGIFSVLATIANGYLLGFVFSLTSSEQGFSVLWKLLPHGIFELPAIFISLGLGLKLGTFVFQEDKKKSFKKYLFNSLKVFLFIVIPLLIIAAIIEGILM